MYFPVEIFFFPIAVVLSVWVVGLPLGRLTAGRSLNRRGKKKSLSTGAKLLIGLVAMPACLGASAGIYIVLLEYVLPPKGIDAVPNVFTHFGVLLLSVMAQICLAVAIWYLAYNHTALPASGLQQQRLPK